MTTEKDIKKLLERYDNFTGSDVKFQKTPCAPGTTLRKSDFEELKDIDKYRSLLGHLMWYTTKVGPDAARELAVHMSHPWPEH